MITHLFESLIIALWNLFRRGWEPRRQRLPSEGEAPAESVSLGTIMRSPSAPPPPAGAPTELRLTTEEKRRHVYLLGSTGTGKTNLLLQLVRADIEQRRSVFLLDFRGELVDRVLMILASLYTPEQLRDRLVLIDLRREDYSVPFNPLREEAADAYTRVRFLMEVLKQQWEIGVQTEQLLRNSLLALSNGWSLYELEVLLTDRAFRDFVLESVQDATVKRFFARFDQLENTSAWVEPVLNKISPWLGRPVLRNMLAQWETVSFHTRLETRPDSIVLVSLAADTLYGDAHLMGSLLTSALTSAAMRPDRRDRPGNEVCFYLDEFEHFDGLGEQIGAILSEGRKFGLCACLSHQTSGQLNPKLRNLIRNVVGTQVFFSVGGGEADTLAGEIASDEPKAIVRNLLMNQKIGECIVVRRGKPYTRIRTKHCPDPTIGLDKIEALRLAALSHFGTPRARIETELAEREAALMSTPAPPLRAKPRRNLGRPARLSGDTAAVATSPPRNNSTKDIILEVRDDDDKETTKPTRSRRKKGSTAP